MDGPKDRHKQFIQERKSKLKLRDVEDQGASKKELPSSVEKEPQEKQSASPGDHAEKVHEYRERQKEKLRKRKHPLDSKGEIRNQKKPKEDDDGG